jgi:hypothetical protein
MNRLVGTILTILFVIIFSYSLAYAQDNDSTYTDYRNYRMVEGGGDKIDIDKTTPLSTLINKLTKDWKLVMTGKRYWIGYTDDMYSIANHGDEAVSALVDFIDSTNNLKAKEGAIYTLHLIGINSRIVGRFIEDFHNKKARNALLKYLPDSTLHKTIVTLLMRDPWLTDVPHIMAFLTLPNRDYSTILSALGRYDINEPGMGQKIPATFLKGGIKVKTEQELGLTPIYALIALNDKTEGKVIVDKEITTSNAWATAMSDMNVKGKYTRTVSIDYILNWNQPFLSYCINGEPYYYIFKGNRVEVYGEKGARQVWLNWWNNMSQRNKDTLFTTDHFVPTDLEKN